VRTLKSLAPAKRIGGRFKYACPLRLCCKICVLLLIVHTASETAGPIAGRGSQNRRGSFSREMVPGTNLESQHVPQLWYLPTYRNRRLHTLTKKIRKTQTPPFSISETNKNIKEELK